MILIVLPGAIVVNRILSNHDTDDKYMALVDGIPISTKEFDKAIEANKTPIIDYFYNKYGAEQTAEFWTTSFEGEIPAESIMNKALEESVKIKIRQLIAREQGMLQDISYEGFLRQLNEENKRRQRAIRNREVIYGPRQYEENAYFEYVLSNTTRLVKGQLMEEQWKPDDQQLKWFYDLRKNQLYLSHGLVKVKLISISFLDSNQSVDEALKEDAKKQMEKALSMAASGTDFEHIPKAFDTDVQMMEKEFNSSNVRSNARSPVAQAAEKLSMNEISGIIEENGRLYLIKCMENQKEGSGFLDFDSVKDQVLKDYADFKYEEYVNKRVSEAQILWNETEYRAYQKM
ncbi:peptidylprolyl isomerase [Paenibacillus sp. LHD-117]|uniref:peptidylprolyl isomerase n=1 Tax=Paenibacillus sp. LHD-117 TaxID=3071412 RepID=UPI0027DF338E|nr:peptidylprolyl isomerase [Paenibacillus sp. LHD-117]MDQ6423181.1 peptidylprolyl isomerase [Paenibacillus sp. LHD-117]